MRLLFFSWIYLLSGMVEAQSPQTLRIRKYVQQNSGTIIREFTEFLSIPNIAADTAGQQATAAFIMAMMNKRGIQKVQLLPATSAGVPPAVYGEVMVAGATQTMIFYAHYDGQPVNRSQWAKELDPFKPILFTGAIDKGGAQIPFPADGPWHNDWRIYARSASDDKAGIAVILDAYDAVRKNGLQPAFNLKFFFVAIFHSHLEYAGQTSAITRRKAALC